ncbi:MAG TPA: hypothetical protein VLV16_15095 [Gemmatimonadales bacterium]|nr:hypothetical protein [Gemmatimonadales bacterium]
MRHVRFLALTGALLVLTECGQPEGPSASGHPFFTATLDGATWVADFSDGFMLGSSTVISGRRYVSPQETEDIWIQIAGPPSVGKFALRGLFSPATGFFSKQTIGAPSLPLPYLSSDANPGVASVDGVNRSDSLIAGTFAFEAAQIPDTGAHHVLSGAFLVRYTAF